MTVQNKVASSEQSSKHTRSQLELTRMRQSNTRCQPFRHAFFRQGDKMMVHEDGNHFIGGRARNRIVDLLEDAVAEVAMGGEIRTIVRARRIDANEKEFIVLLCAHSLAVHPGIADILARPIVIARNERDPPLLQQWRKNVTKKCIFGVRSFMSDIARHDDVVYVIGQEPFDERFRALG
jgi:hypothetical protein